MFADQQNEAFKECDRSVPGRNLEWALFVLAIHQQEKEEYASRGSFFGSSSFFATHSADQPALRHALLLTERMAIGPRRTLLHCTIPSLSISSSRQDMDSRSCFARTSPCDSSRRHRRHLWCSRIHVDMSCQQPTSACQRYVLQPANAGCSIFHLLYEFEDESLKKEHQEHSRPVFLDSGARVNNVRQAKANQSSDRRTRSHCIKSPISRPQIDPSTPSSSTCKSGKPRGTWNLSGICDTQHGMTRKARFAVNVPTASSPLA